MESTEEQKKVFDEVAATSLVETLRASYTNGKTRSYEWRVAQLKSMSKMIDEHESDIVAALRHDLSKPELESTVYEVTFNSIVTDFMSIINACFRMTLFSVNFVLLFVRSFVIPWFLLCDVDILMLDLVRFYLLFVSFSFHN